MSWKQTWDDILAGGSPRWKVDDDTAKATALGHIVRHLPPEKAAKIFCPLAGDDPFVRHAHLRGHSVVAMDLVPAAVSAMRGQFGAGETSWAKEASGGAIVWKHESGRATLYEGDAFAKRPELGGTFDAVYDKDSFGALDLSMRGKLCERLAEYCKDGAVVYVEVKAKDENHPGRHAGPPFHVGKDDLMQQGNFGTSFEYVEELGEVYPIGVPQMRQTGHVLKRKPRS